MATVVHEGRRREGKGLGEGTGGRERQPQDSCSCGLNRLCTIARIQFCSCLYVPCCLPLVVVATGRVSLFSSNSQAPRKTMLWYVGGGWIHERLRCGWELALRSQTLAALWILLKPLRWACRLVCLCRGCACSADPSCTSLIGNHSSECRSYSVFASCPPSTFATLVSKLEQHLFI